MTNFTPEKCKQIALARLDIVHKWLEFRNKSQNKLQADYDFVKLHNTSNSHLFEILGEMCIRDRFMTMGFLSLPVIPELKVTDKGVFDTNKFDFIDIFEKAVVEV